MTDMVLASKMRHSMLSFVIYIAGESKIVFFFFLLRCPCIGSELNVLHMRVNFVSEVL